jgi:hypothetical protein
MLDHRHALMAGDDVEDAAAVRPLWYGYRPPGPDPPLVRNRNYQMAPFIRL